MGTVGCMANFIKNTSRVTVRIRIGTIRDDGRLLPDRFRTTLPSDFTKECSSRNHSTRVQTAGVRLSTRTSTTVNNTAVSEDMTCVSKHLHICRESEERLPTCATLVSTSKVPLLPAETPSESTVETNNEILCCDGDGKNTLCQDSWTYYPNVSDEVRWIEGPIHTYDSSFMIPNIVPEGTSKENPKVMTSSDVVLYENSLVLPHESVVNNENKSLVRESISKHKEDKNSKTLKKNKKSKKASKKAKNLVVKETTADVKIESTSPPPRSKKHKVSVVKNDLQEEWCDMAEVLEEDTDLFESNQTSINLPAPSSTKGKKGVKKLKKNIKEEDKEVRRRGREASFNQSLASYISMCINLGMLNRATHTLLYYRQYAYHSTRKSESQKVTSIQPYNLILQGYANKKNFKKMKELFSCIKEDEIEPTETTYALMLSCLGQLLDSADTTENINTYLQDMKMQGIKIQDMFQYAEVFPSLDYVMKAISHVDPDFEIQKVKPVTTYSCNLVNELNGTIHSTKVPSPAHGLVSQETLNEWIEEQFALEIKSDLVINSIEKKVENKDTRHYRRILGEWEDKWRSVLHQTFITQVVAMKKSFYSSGLERKMSIYPYLVCLPPEEFTNVMMQEIQRLARGSESFSLTKYMMYRRLGEMVYMRYLVNYKKDTGVLDKLKAIYKGYTTWYMENEKEENVTYIPRVRWQELSDIHCSGPSVEHIPVEWPNTVKTSIGKFMYSIILPKVMLWNPLTAKKNVYPALYEVERNVGYKTVDEIKPSPSLVELYEKAAKSTLTFESIASPMVCPPIPWVSTKLGGYLLNNAKIVRLPFNAYLQRKRMEECGNQQLYPIMDSLNQLSAIPWRVNKPMLEIITELFNNNGCEELEIPQPPSQCPKPQKITHDMSKTEIKKMRHQQLSYEQRKNEMHSLWCDALYKLSLANHFKDRVFWFPHNMDFRGRVYPCPPHLNHLSSDVFRSILMFAKGEKLGSDGLKWLKLHLINLTGFVKREPISDRIKYCESLMEEIFDSADNPLTGQRWWTKSDEPWQTLAACKELAAAMRSGDPEEYVSHLPIHQDGSCNGLQHYAALGRDKIGAISVNLAPSKAPQDVYSDVVALVEAERQKDAASGNPVAEALEGHIKRKVIKQTIMTTVYGVTRYGARLQIEKQLKALHNFPSSQRWAASHYLVHKTFVCLEKMFTSTKEIQTWLTDCAKIVSEIRRENLEYVTPLGLPVVQPYSRFISNQTAIGKFPSTFYVDAYMKPNVMKQKNAFPPNFIHSLDSTHMMLTSLFSQQAGITFVSVHDCFWTHACSVNTMNKICRRQFVALHTEPILEDLSNFLNYKFGLSNSEFTYDGSPLDSSKMKLNKIVRNVPSKGDFDINNVLKSVYFFS